jgi:phosphatidylserine/phosphatidylglycerophosphate/cardiolipin synthase-like enzyme
MPLITKSATAVQVVHTYDVAETYPWQTFTKTMNVTTFVAPDSGMDELLNILWSAEESIYVEIYGINHPHILDAIHEIHTAKPSVDMKFLIGWNSLGYYSPNDWVANNLTTLGLPVRWTSDDDFSYAHQKFLVIDNKTVVVQAGNWAKTSFIPDGYKANREWSIAMTDTDVAGFYVDVFDGDWHNGTVYDAGTHGTGDPLTYNPASSTYPRFFAESGHFSGEMSVTPILSPDTSLQGILYAINYAQVTLDVQIPYFTNYEEGGSVDDIIDALVAASNRGVTVRVIMEEGPYDNDDVAEHFHSHGISVAYQDERWFTAMHNKGIIADGKLVLLSSINYSDNSIENNREAGVIIENELIAQWYQQVYDFDWEIGDTEEEVNLYWTPNIPTSSSIINVSVYTLQLYPDVDEVILGVKIGAGAWTNHTITANVYESPEEDEESYYYEIPQQADGTNITVRAFVEAAGMDYSTLEMVIHVTDEISEIDLTPPVIDSPADIEYERDTTGHSIIWTASDENPDDYRIFQNGTGVVADTWTSGQIEHSVDGLSVGLYVFEIIVNDVNDNSATDTVLVRVTPTLQDQLIFIAIAGVAAVVVLVLAVVFKKKR